MVGATLPFQFGAGAKTVQRPLATSDAGFAGAMDDAIGVPAARRDDGPRAATAARSRRPEPAAPRREDNAEATANARRASSDARKPAADRVEDKPGADEVAKPEREAQQVAAGDTEAAAADERAEPHTEMRDTPQASAPKAEIPVEIDGDVIIDDGVEGEGRSVLGDTGEEEVEPQSGELKRPVAAAGEETGADLAKGAGRARGRGWTGTSGPEREQAHGTAHARAAVAIPAGEATGELVKAAAHAALDQTGTAVAQAAALAKAAEPAPSAKEAAEEAVAAFAEAGAAVESVSAAENDANADVTDSGAREREQPRAAAPSTRMGDAVASAAGLSDGVRFTATAAAGSAAYASAAPRPEVHVLPQIVQSIKLQTAQGTSEARVQLRPEHLGALNIALKVENGHVTATIHAENPAVRQWIEANEASLRQSLSEQGLQLSKLVVHPDGQQEQDGREQEPRRQSPRRSWRDEDVTFEVVV